MLHATQHLTLLPDQVLLPKDPCLVDDPQRVLFPRHLVVALSNDGKPALAQDRTDRVVVFLAVAAVGIGSGAREVCLADHAGPSVEERVGESVQEGNLKERE